MATDETDITQAITQAAIGKLKAAIQAKAIAASKGTSQARSEPTRTEPKLGRVTVRQPTFDWSSADKHIECGNLMLEGMDGKVKGSGERIQL